MRKLQVLPVVLAMLGCTGDILSGGPTLGGIAGGGPGTPPPPTSNNPPPDLQLPHFSCQDPALRGTTNLTFRRLTRFELENTLRDVFGTDVVTTLALQLSGYAPDVLRTPADFSALHTSASVNAIADTVMALAENVSQSPSQLKRLAPSCLFDGSGKVTLQSSSCVQTFVTQLGLQLLRRPLATAERDAYLATLAANDPSATLPQEKVAVVLGQMLLEPEAVFHMTHARTPQGARVAVDPYTAASRLSYAAIGSCPDAELYAAAAAGQLSTAEQLTAQARRLLTDEVPASDATFREHRGRRFVRRFYDNWLITPLSRQADAFYSTYFGVDATAVRDGLTEEAERFAEHVTFDLNAGHGSFGDLMTANLAFPPNADAAKIVGTDVSQGAADPKQVTDARRGLFQRPILMVSDEPRTSPIHRGAVFLKQLACVDLGTPPANADNVAAATKATLDLNQVTARQIATAETSAALCTTCHSQINPPGFVFEAFGPLGELRAQEKIFDVNRVLVNTLPIDPSADVTLDGVKQTITGTVELAGTLAGSSQVKACLAQQLFRQTRFLHEAAADTCVLSDIETTVRSGGSLIDAFAISAGTEDLLWEL